MCTVALMADPSLPEIRRLVTAANAARRRSDVPDGAAETDGQRAERRLDRLFGTGRTLAVYGTLAPGQPNHHVLAPLGGEWTEGVIRGDLFHLGWGAALGYPGFRPRDEGDAVTVSVLVSASLADAWPDLDRFEGPGYERILVPVFPAQSGPKQTGELRPYTVANLYAAAEADPGPHPEASP
ncbi:AIG2-like family (plasmid) [Rubrobacter radiotolerans]|uniref:AIG2-like family n=2 Tax=Rubrobacter radiotolerans TaxID=42256 RepID=A0A023X892_RUBRA|nr:gamma-glutamylcyclotransferase family protein [Rubrobacter radiotolerans]AHY48265.1 AIG2-like family [Rubrobacter radiotolerans]SMC01462.1 Uncharacterized conserved protein YtfP, gamma-glutamylcyclotransferase (GGCT)/AIG2-like family [Rubrobacter radiotolerans DSM 5868]